MEYLYESHIPRNHSYLILSILATHIINPLVPHQVRFSSWIFFSDVNFSFQIQTFNFPQDSCRIFDPSVRVKAEPYLGIAEMRELKVKVKNHDNN